MQSEVTDRPKLYSHKTRGNSQIIRSTLLELGIQFEEISVKSNGRLQSSNTKCDIIQTDNLPCLVHDGNVLYELFAILKYLCTYFNKKELLGKDINEKIRISEILVKCSKEKNSVLTVLLMGIKQISTKKLGVQAFPKLADVFLDMLHFGQHYQAMENMFEKTGGFLGGELTVLDFVFYEKCFMYVNILSKTNKKSVQKMTKYIEFFQETEFYLKNKDYLQTFCLYDQKIDQECKVLLEQLWSGDKKVLLFKKS